MKTEWHREPFIKSEYRKHNSTFWQCLKSLFYLHNQSFNVWSHILVSLYFLVHFSQTLSEDTPPIFDPFNLPMLSAGIGTVTVYLTSGSAHLFNPMSEKAYKTCFFFDYAGISLMTFTSCQVLFFYTRPMNTGWMIFESPSLFFSVASCLSFLGTYLCCKTNSTNNVFSTSLRAAAFLAGYLNTTVHYLGGAVFCSCLDDDTCLAFSACGRLSRDFYVSHVVNMILSDLLYSGRFPERIFPGMFDLIGQGHQLMHVLSAIGTEFAYRMIELHRKQAQESAVKMVATVSRVSLFNTLMLTIFMLVLNAGIVLWFGLASGSDSMDSMVEPAEWGTTKWLEYHVKTSWCSLF